MKRTQSRTIHLTRQPGRAVRAIDASRLPAIRGGTALDITVQLPHTNSEYLMMQQHNEALVAL